MLRKFIGLTAVLMLVICLPSWMAPVLSPDIDVGAAGASMTAESADSDVMASEAALILEANSLAVPVTATGETAIWLALGASLLTTAVAYGRRLHQKLCDLTAMSLRNLRGSSNEGAGMGAGTHPGI